MFPSGVRYKDARIGDGVLREHGKVVGLSGRDDRFVRGICHLYESEIPPGGQLYPCKNDADLALLAEFVQTTVSAIGIGRAVNRAAQHSILPDDFHVYPAHRLRM